MQNQPSGLDRIDAALESLQQRMGTHFDQQMQLNTALRTDLEVQKNTSEALRNATEALRNMADTLLQIVELHQQNIEVIAEAVRQHRADGHKA